MENISEQENEHQDDIEANNEDNTEGQDEIDEELNLESNNLEVQEEEEVETHGQDQEDYDESETIEDQEMFNDDEEENGEQDVGDEIEVDNEDNTEGQDENVSFTKSQFPISKVKKIMKLALSDEDCMSQIINADTVYILSRATELFVSYLAQETDHFTTSSKKKILSKQHLQSAILHREAFDFLEGCLPIEGI